MNRSKIWPRLLLLGFLAASLTFAGCEGDDGSNGAPGDQGPAGTTGATGPQGPVGPAGTAIVDAGTASPEALAALAPTVTVTGVTIASPPVVDFAVTDSAGRGIAGLEVPRMSDARFIRFTLAKLVPGTNGDPNVWVSYVRDSDNLPTYDNAGTLVDHGNGAYTYTFATDVTAVAGIVYDASLTHRLGAQIGNSSFALPAINFSHDFIPAGGTITTMRDIAMTASCNECHGKLTVHGRRFEVKYCVTCHNPDLVEAGSSYDMPVMVHKIHAADPTWRNGFAAEVTYPMDLRNCRKCHDGTDAATPQGDNWKAKPTIAACGACHIGVNFADGTGHAGGAQTSNAACATCHPAAVIEEYHLTEIATPNNPNVETGLTNFFYEVASVTVDPTTNVPSIVFRIQQNTGSMTAAKSNVVLDGDSSAALLGYTGGPSFLLAYYLPAVNQAQATSPDYNNAGRSAAQPLSVSIASLMPGGANGSLAGPDVDGFYTATISNAAVQFPVGAALRAVGLQGYFTQAAGTNGIAAATARHALSAVKAVAGEERREVVDSGNCGACHEWFEGHGGNRVIGAATVGDAICTLCHVPNLSTSGRAANPATLPQATIDALGNDPSTFPEDTNNLKDMIHGIHAAGIRTNDYEFVRNRLGGLYYNWSEVTFPGILENCHTCHQSGTFALDEVPAGVLPTTVVTTDGNPATTVSQDRATLPNAADEVVSPLTSACYYCHDSDLAKTHMNQNGAFFGSRGTLVPAETCILCHGPGRTADIARMHAVQ